MHRHVVDVRGASVAFRDGGGQGRPIVLVHGSSASSAVWSRLYETPLAERWRLVALDLPGCGDSGRLERYTISGLVDVIVEFARGVEAADALFVGHSLGGHLVLEAGPRLERARGFAIFATPPLGRPPEVERAFLPSPALALSFRPELSDGELAEFIAALAGPAHAATAELASLARRTDPRLRAGLGESVAALAYADEVEIARSLTRPLAVLHGARDAVVSRRYLEELPLPTLWRGAVQVIASAGHYAQLDSPAEVAGLLGAFAAELEA